MMNYKRYNEINRTGYGLTKEDLAEGWHFCPESGQDLIGPGMEQMKSCTCHKDKHNEDAS